MQTYIEKYNIHIVITSLEYSLLKYINNKYINIDLVNLFNYNMFWAINTFTNNLYHLEYIINGKIYKEHDMLSNTYINIKFELEEIPKAFATNILNCYPKHYLIKSVILTSINNKRKNRDIEVVSDNISEDYKKQKKEVNWDMMVSASSTRNYFLNDPLLDYLKFINNSSTNNSSTNNSISLYENFETYIMKQGIEYEKKVIEEIRKNHKVYDIYSEREARSTKLFEQTIECMRKGEKIIYQGVLHNYKNSTYGIPDLLIRSDYINKFVGYDIYNEEHRSLSIERDYHYVVVDIKHSVIHLSSDKSSILNEGSVPAFKGQLLVYTKALNNILGTNITKAFVLGKKYVYETKGIKYEIEDIYHLGKIDYRNKDQWVNIKLNQCLEWFYELRMNGKEWKLNPPSRKELYPNMKNEKYGYLAGIKKDLAKEINEITSIYYCNYEKRNALIDKGINSWKDHKCTSKNMGFKEGIISKRVDAILDINRSDDLIRNHCVVNKIPKQRLFYLDFETLNNAIGEYDDFVFMIGVGYEDNKQWKYKVFTVKAITENEEKTIFTKFWEYIDNICNNPLFIHWSQAEKIVYQKVKERTGIKDIKLYDLNKLFIDELIVVKEAFNWSLKEISKAMFKHGFIQTLWDNGICSDGLSAMIIAKNIYDKNKVVDNEMLRSIIKYNEIDCKVMYEIICYLKTNI
jgi:hypothetical protein